jgi:hypothetical protein
MTLVSGQVYSNYNRTSCGTELSLAGKFPCSWRCSSNQNFKYTVGDNCSTGSTNVKDATLTDLKVGGQTVASFVPGKLTYSVVLPKEQQRYLKLLQ